VDVVLHIGHRVREDANVQRIPAFSADLIPDLRKQVASSLTLASMMTQLHPLANVDLKLVSRLEFGSGAVAMRYEPRR
jgi:hypothetical protein